MRLYATVAALVVVLFAAFHAAAQPLPFHPRLVRGQLENGLTYIIMDHKVPPGRTAIWLRVGTGSLGETDEQRGIAHYLEHLAFNGSANFPPGSVIPFFESLGLTFGQHQNAFTSFDQTVYQIALPDNSIRNANKGLLFLADVAWRLSLLPEEIEEEREIIMEEKRSRLGVQQRIMDVVLRELAPGSLLGERNPIGVEETIRGVQEADFRAFYERWYVPSNMHLVIVADMDPEMAESLVRDHFTAAPKRDAPPRIDPGVQPYAESDAVVITDPELTRSEITIYRIGPARPPVTDEGAYRARLVEQLGSLAFNRRLDAKIASGEMPFLSAGAGVSQQFQAIRIATASANGRPDRWREITERLCIELQRARLHGFTAQEIADAKTEMIAGAERAVEIEPTLPARAILASINQSLTQGEPIMSAEQELELIRKYVPGITPREIISTFAANLDMQPSKFFLTLPESEPAPTKEELLAIGLAALAQRPDADGDVDRPAALMETPPKPGEVASIEHHAASDVWSAWLSNNVRLHYRYMDYKKEDASITISLAGGQIEETASNRGISDAAILAFNRTATRGLSSINVRDLMTGKKVSVGGRSTPDAMTLTISGNPADFDIGMQLAYLLLTEPRIEDAAFSDWKERQIQIIAMNKMTPDGMFREVFWSSLLPDDEVRIKPTTEAHIRALTLEASQAWLERIIKAPMEVAIVGDISRERAFDLAQTYLASLPMRDRISADTLRPLRPVNRPKGPRLADVSIETQTDKAIVAGAFFTTSHDKVRERRILSLASQIMTSRMVKRLREQEQLVYSIAASSSPGIAHPEMGLFMAGTFTEANKADALAAAICDMYEDFAVNGPTEEEVATAKRQAATNLDEQMREPRFWTNQLNDLTYRARSLDDVLEEPEALQAFTPEQIRETFRAYCTPENRINVIVRPRLRVPQ